MYRVLLSIALGSLASETLAHLVRIHASGRVILSFHSRGVRRGVPQRLELPIDSTLAPSGALNADVCHALAVVRLDDPDVP